MASQHRVAGVGWWADMKWPKLFEKRSQEPSGNYTTDRIALAVLGAGGASLRGVAGAVETASGMWQRGLSVARVEPRNNRTAWLDGFTLGHIGRYLLRHGQVVFELRIVGGQVEMVPAQSWNVAGGPDPQSWEWELTFAGPSYREVRRLPAERVLNLVYAVDASAPWVGISPLNAAGITSAMMANIETAFAQESATARGYAIPVPDVEAAGTLQADLRDAAGKLLLVPSVQSDVAWDQGTEASQRDDYMAKRFGFNPPQGMVMLRKDVELSILAAAGVPVSIMSLNDGTAKREGARQFTVTLQGVVKILIPQLRLP